MLHNTAEIRCFRHAEPDAHYTAGPRIKNADASRNESRGGLNCYSNVVTIDIMTDWSLIGHLAVRADMAVAEALQVLEKHADIGTRLCARQFVLIYGFRFGWLKRLVRTRLDEDSGQFSIRFTALPPEAAGIPRQFSVQDRVVHERLEHSLLEVDSHLGAIAQHLLRTPRNGPPNRSTKLLFVSCGAQNESSMRSKRWHSTI